jgi:hypothetical protein
MFQFSIVVWWLLSAGKCYNLRQISPRERFAGSCHTDMPIGATTLGSRNIIGGAISLQSERLPCKQELRVPRSGPRILSIIFSVMADMRIKIALGRGPVCPLPRSHSLGIGPR